MTYQRMRSRNGLLFRKPVDDPDPYWRVPPPDAVGPTVQEKAMLMLVGDMNRMERDYLNPVYPEKPWVTREPGSDPLSQVVAATGVDEESVLKVLYYMFYGQP